MTIQANPSLVVIDVMTFGNVDDTLIGWVYTSIDGWYDGPGVRASFTPRTFDHGSFDSPVYRDVRVVTLTGVYMGSSYADAVAQSMLLAALLGDGTPGVITVDGISATVRLSGQPSMSWIGDAAFNYQASFTAVDPKKYATPLSPAAISMIGTSSGGLVFPLVNTVFRWGTVSLPPIAMLTNPGTADTSVQMTVAAGASALTGGFQIVETTTGSVLQYSDDLPAGSSVAFDSATGSVILNGTANRRGSLTIAQWWQIPAGATRTVTFTGLAGTSATATLTASTRPAYW